ncbi:MAG: hypothetical protein AAF804_01785 [Bacteroidota bacterium]
MKKLIIIIVIALSWLGSSFAQTQSLPRLVLIDAETKQPVAFARVSWSLAFVHSLSNEDGQVILASVSESDTLMVKHFSYQELRIPLGQVPQDTLFLVPRDFQLAGVDIYGLTGRAVMERVIDHLDQNYRIQKVFYRALVRDCEYEQDRSVLHTITEFDLEVYHRKRGLAQYQVQQGRMMAFSEPGKEALPEKFMIPTAEIVNCDIAKADRDILKKRHLDGWEIRIDSVFQAEGRELIHLTLEAKPGQDNRVYRYQLSVDMASHAIVKLLRYQKFASGNRYTEIGFREQGGKWYLAYSLARGVSNLYEDLGYMSSSATVSEQFSFYQLSKRTDQSLGDFRGYMAFAPSSAQKYVSDWSHPHWQDYDALPWPDWIAERLEAEGLTQ